MVFYTHCSSSQKKIGAKYMFNQCWTEMAIFDLNIEVSHVSYISDNFSMKGDEPLEAQKSNRNKNNDSVSS